MDGQKFDSLARDFASSPGRRRVLRAGGAILASIVALSVGTDVSAKSLRKEGQTCRSTSECGTGSCLITTDGRRRCTVCRGETVVGSQLIPDYGVRDACCLPEGAHLEGGCTYETVYDCCVYPDREDEGVWWIGCNPDTGTCVNSQDVHPTALSTSSNLLVLSV